MAPPKSHSVFRNVLLPSIVFLPISALLFKHIMLGMSEKLGPLGPSYCPPNLPFEKQGASPYQLHYTGGYLPEVEASLCGIIAAFDQALSPANAQFHRFLEDFGASLWVYAAVPLVESYRVNSPVWSGTTMLLLSIAQLYGGAVVLPVFWLLLLILTRKVWQPSSVLRGDAESIFFGTLVGYVLPCYMVARDPTVMNHVLWQLFPVNMTVLAFVYRQVRPKTSANSSGHSTVCTMYMVIFAVCAYSHYRTLSSLDFDVYALWEYFGPKTEMPTSAEDVVKLMYVLQWDYFFIFAEMGLAALWLVADSMGEMLVVVVWYVVGSVLFGTGSAIAALWYWREKKIRGGIRSSKR